MHRVLILGASVAGPTLAYWLHKGGYSVTVVERAKELRLGGQNIDIKGAAKEVAKRMGIYEDVKNCTTGELGTHFVDAQNNVTASFDKGQVGGMTTNLEILRGDLANILYNHTKDHVEYRFGDEIEKIKDTGKHVEVVFKSGSE